MGFTQAVSICFSKYVVWEGRARRSEYWWFALFTSLGSFVAAIIDFLLFPGLLSSGGAQGGPIGALFSLAIFLPSLSVTIRRLHDLDKSGWWFWLILVPIIGWIVLFVFMVSQGTRGRNSFGEDPITFH